jgi:lipopolysaccharide export LptBFGC system permease protein LptF
MFTVQNFVVICFVVVVLMVLQLFFGENIKREQGTPTIHRTAGVGVIFLIWIIVSISGICPSHAPA